MTAADTQRAALVALIEAVEAGAAGAGHFRKAFPSNSIYRDSLEGVDAARAFGGSLDAAKALHDALLPGYIMQSDSTGYAHCWKDEHETTMNYFALCPGNEARARLLASLNAKLAQASLTGG